MSPCALPAGEMHTQKEGEGGKDVVNEKKRKGQWIKSEMTKIE